MAASKKWKCEVCGYIHEGPEPPDVCPVCGVGPEMFTAFSEEPVEAPGAGAWRCTICNYVHEGDAPPELCPVCGAAADMFEPHDEGEAPAASEPSGDRILVVGGGAAAFTAIEAARKASADVRITMIHKEPDLPYNRLNLTRLLAGEVDETALPLQGSDWYAERHVETVRGEVVEIDRSTRAVLLRDGTRVTYDRLLLANGSHAFVPPILGATREGVVSLRTREDALVILERAGKKGARCVCIGGGLLGLETAGALAKRGAEVTVVEGFDWLLPRQLAEPAARLLQGHVEGLGVRVLCGVRTEEITGDEQARGVKIKDGDELAADIVVLATGVRPNSHLARSAGLEVNRGVVVDDRMRTSDASIYAAGDVSEHRGVVFGLWPIALGQGAVAGANLAGGSEAFTNVSPPTQLKVLDVEMFSIGEFAPNDGSFRVFEQRTGDAYYRLVCRDGQVVGANLFGDTGPAGTIKTAVEQGLQLDEVRPKLDRFENLANCLSD